MTDNVAIDARAIDFQDLFGATGSRNQVDGNLQLHSGRGVSTSPYWLHWQHAAGVAGAVIARMLWRSKSTISRELRRNAREGLYLPDTAERLAKERRWRGCKIERDPELRGYITSQIAMARWSPGRLAGRMLKFLRGHCNDPMERSTPVSSVLQTRPAAERRHQNSAAGAGCADAVCR